MASLELLPRKEFIITLEDGTKIPGQFGTWTLKRFGDKRNVGLAGLAEVLLKPLKNPDGSNKLNEKGEQQYDISINDMIDLILCACEYKARLNNEKNFAFNEVQFCKWMDDCVYSSDESGMLMKLYSHSVSDEKKSELPADV